MPERWRARNEEWAESEEPPDRPYRLTDSLQVTSARWWIATLTMTVAVVTIVAYLWWDCGLNGRCGA